jgi:hypothetical protein
VADKRVRWLAAYALGLAIAGNLEDAVADRSAQADGDAAGLDAARGHLDMMDVRRT